MKTPFDFDKAAQDVFSSEGAPAGPELWRPQCVTTEAARGFHPRHMPSLAIACPANQGTTQRYRGPLWRPFRPAAEGG